MWQQSYEHRAKCISFNIIISIKNLKQEQENGMKHESSYIYGDNKEMSVQ